MGRTLWVRGIRGAAPVPENTPEAIRGAARELLRIIADHIDLTIGIDVFDSNTLNGNIPQQDCPLFPDLLSYLLPFPHPGEEFTLLAFPAVVKANSKTQF